MRRGLPAPRLPSIPQRAAAAAIAVCFAALLIVPLAVDRSLLATEPEVARALVGVFGSVLALVVVALVGYGLLDGGLGSDAGVESLVDAPPERGGEDEDVLVGAALRDGVDRAAHLRDEGVTSTARDVVWKEIRTAAAVAEEHATGASTEEARERVAEGRWTDDAVVAAFLASPEADVRYPARHVLYEWLTPGGAFERRAEQAAEAVRERYEAEGAVPDPERLPPVRPVAPREAPDEATAALGPDLADAVEAGASEGLVALPTTDEVALREGFRSAAAAAVAATDADSDAVVGADPERETDARTAVRNGEWTDDPVAAAFLADAAAAVDRSLVDILYGAVDPSGALDRRVRRTASAVLARCESLSIEAEDSHGGRGDADPVEPAATADELPTGHAGDAATDDEVAATDESVDASTGSDREVAFRWSSEAGSSDDAADGDDELEIHEVSLEERR